MVGRQENILTPERRRYCDALLKQRNKAGVFLKNVKQRLSIEDKTCLEDSYSLKAVSDFKFFIGQAPRKSFEAKTIRDFFSERYALYLLREYYTNLANQKPGLSAIVTTIKRENGNSPIKILLPVSAVVRGENSDTADGCFYVREDIVSLPFVHRRGNDLPITNVLTIYHELGHKLMYHLYGKKIPKVLQNHHAKKTTKSQSITDPGAAWAEGFANALSVLDFSSVKVAEPSCFKTAKWKGYSLRTKFSNEFLVAGVLCDFLRKARSGDNKRSKLSYDKERFRKIVTAMKIAGIQQSFQEFLADYLTLYPEDKRSFLTILKEYDVIKSETEMSELLGKPNFIERFVLKYDKPWGAKVSLYSAEKVYRIAIKGLDQDNPARMRAWVKLKKQGVRAKLLSRNVPIREQIHLMRKAKRFIQSEIKKDRWIPL